MARQIYKIEGFLGVNESINQNNLANGMSPDACNIDTYDGSLTVAKGYVRHIADPVPGEGQIHAVRFFNGNGVSRTVVIAGDVIYAHDGTAWSAVYTYSALTNHSFDFALAQINSVDYLLIASGESQIVKYDGTTAALFGSAEEVSDINVNYLAMYKYRLFSAGDADHPNRLYWSQLPGDTRSIESWGPVEASANVEGGHTEVGGVSGDPIVALAALSNQLLIFKRRSLYRLIGDKPGNFIVEELDATMLGCAHTAMVKTGDVLYFLASEGMQCFNGVSVSRADGRMLIKTLAAAETANTRSAKAGDKLLFSVTETGGDALIEYDLARGTFMLRRGFGVRDMCAHEGKAYIVNDRRYVYRFNEGNDYDGVSVQAWWQTPLTDAGEKGTVKAMRQLYLRGSTQNEAALLVDVSAGGVTATHRALLPESLSDVLELPLSGEGRTFSMRFYNEAGGRFTLEGGAELQLEQWRRVE